MRFLPYLILAYAALGLQIGLGDYVTWHGAPPNLVLVAVLFVALNAPPKAALLGCFTLGLVQDFLCQPPAGLHALSYGLVAMGVIAAQHVLNRDHPLTHFGLAVFGGLVTACVLALHLWLRPPASAAPGASADATLPALPVIRGPVLPLFIAAGYTAVLAPVLFWILGRFKRSLSFRGHYRRTWA